MQVLILGEDAVTRSIMKKLIRVFRPDLDISPREEPIRGGNQLQSKLSQYIQLANKNFPIVALVDADTQCPPSLISQWLKDEILPENMIFRIAVDEAESWLLADRGNIATYLKVHPSKIPESTSIKNEFEISYSLPIKSSLYLMLEIASLSKSQIIREQLTPRNMAKKGPEYNSALLPFIQKIWNPEKARINSSSLDRAIKSLEKFLIV